MYQFLFKNFTDEDVMNAITPWGIKRSKNLFKATEEQRIKTNQLHIALSSLTQCSLRSTVVYLMAK